MSTVYSKNPLNIKIHNYLTEHKVKKLNIFACQKKTTTLKTLLGTMSKI